MTWTEHRTHQLRCRHCRSRTSARLPGQIARSGFGPRFQAAVVTLTAAYRVSRRGVSELARDLFGARLSVGTIDAICQRATEALAGPHLQLQDWVLDQDAVHVDETGWRTRGVGRALWTATTPRRSDSLVHVILDNSSTHKTPAIQKWLAGHPRFVLHFTPTSSSWLNLVERWFAEPTNKKAPPRNPPLRPSTQRRHPRMDRHLEREPPTVLCGPRQQTRSSNRSPVTAQESMNHDTRVRSAFWVGCRIADTVGSYWSKVCRQAGGEPAVRSGLPHLAASSATRASRTSRVFPALAGGVGDHLRRGTPPA